MKILNLDVRSDMEWDFDGHASCAVNMPLETIPGKLDSLRGYDKINLVCRSGGRAAMAQRLLEQAGIREVFNLGAWQNLSCS